MKDQFIQVFSILEKFDSVFFGKLKKIYEKLNITEKILLGYHNDFEKNQEDITKLKLFKNSKIEDFFPQMEEQDKKDLLNKLKDIHDIAHKKLILGEEEHEHCEDCPCNDNNLFNSLMNNKKIKKLLNKKGLKQKLESELKKQLGQDVDLEGMLKKGLGEIPKENIDMMKNLLDNDMVKNMCGKLFTEENLKKIKTSFFIFLDENDVFDELEKIKDVFNENNVTGIFDNITKQVSSLESLENYEEVMKLFTENSDVKSLMNTFEEAKKKKIIDEEKIFSLGKKLMDHMMVELKDMGILNDMNLSFFGNMFKQYNLSSFFADDTKKETKESRREKAKKKYRREMRQKLKRKNNRKRRK
jgi:hypothetical protein